MEILHIWAPLVLLPIMMVAFTYMVIGKHQTP